MKYNSKYNVWVSKDGLVYCLKHDKLVLRINNEQKGYIRNQTAKGQCLQHRIVWETFNGEIPEGYEVDHINNVRSDNRLCNLQLLTRLDNMRKAHKGRPKSREQRAKIGIANSKRTPPLLGRKRIIVNGKRKYIKQEETHAQS